MTASIIIIITLLCTRFVFDVLLGCNSFIKPLLIICVVAYCCLFPMIFYFSAVKLRNTLSISYTVCVGSLCASI